MPGSTQGDDSFTKYPTMAKVLPVLLNIVFESFFQQDMLDIDHAQQFERGFFVFRSVIRVSINDVLFYFAPIKLA